MPDLALGCLVKPFSEEDLVRALKAAEDIIRGRERLRPSRPGNLRLYAEEEAAAEAVAGRSAADPGTLARAPNRQGAGGALVAQRPAVRARVRSGVGRLPARQRSRRRRVGLNVRSISIQP